MWMKAMENFARATESNTEEKLISGGRTESNTDDAAGRGEIIFWTESNTDDAAGRGKIIFWMG